MGEVVLCCDPELVVTDTVACACVAVLDIVCPTPLPGICEVVPFPLRSLLEALWSFFPTVPPTAPPTITPTIMIAAMSTVILPFVEWRNGV